MPHEARGMTVRMARGRALGLLGAGAAAAVPRSARAQSGSPALRLGTNISDAFAEPWYALDAGYLDRAGITASLQIFAGSGATATALAAGAIDLAVIDAVAVANAQLHGVDFIAIAPSGLFRVADPSSVLCVDKSSSLSSARDLVGKLVSVPSLQSLTTVAVQAWLQRNKVDPAAVKFIEVPFGAVAAALAHGTVACGYIGEPLLSEALAANAKIFAVPYVVFGNVSAINVWVTTRGWLDKNRDLARRFCAAMYATAAWANQHPDQTAAILAKYAKIDIDRVRAMRRATYATSYDPSLIKSQLELAAEFKAIPRAYAVDEIMVKP
jgi:NitT/TauT family transport system substrate-binding protein